jgi:S1-C subfamily serine protease
VWSADGLIVAAHHNLERDEDITIGLPGGETATAQVVGRDPTTDLALLRTSRSGLSVPEWREPDGLKVGHVVLALTRPGESVRARLGIVHALGGSWRTGAGASIDRYIESDVSIQEAFSGGLLIDEEGRGIGVDNAGLLHGASVAVPIATLRRVVGALATHGRIRRGRLGIGTTPVRLPASPIGPATGLVITSVQPDTPAAAAGLLVGDVLLKVDGAPLGGAIDLLPHLEEGRIGSDLRLTIVRGGELREVGVSVAERPQS